MSKAESVPSNYETEFPPETPVALKRPKDHTIEFKSRFLTLKGGAVVYGVVLLLPNAERKREWVAFVGPKEAPQDARRFDINAAVLRPELYPYLIKLHPSALMRK